MKEHQEQRKVLNIKPIIKENMIGEIGHFNHKKNFGFIKPIEGDYRDIFVHKDEVLPEEIKFMRVNQRVTYDFVEDGEGLHAKNVRVIMDENTIMPIPESENNEANNEDVEEDTDDVELKDEEFD